jgi:hypothetical protein
LTKDPLSTAHAHTPHAHRISYGLNFSSVNIQPTSCMGAYNGVYDFEGGMRVALGAAHRCGRPC